MQCRCERRKFSNYITFWSEDLTSGHFLVPALTWGNGKEMHEKKWVVGVWTRFM